jgi:uncharacterized protein YggU (UPF0235/DUF167 family)
VRLTVRVTPRAGRDALDGWGEDASGRRLLKLKVRAAPADGQANEAVRRLIAAELGLPPSAVRLLQGASARIKTLEVEADEVWVRARLEGPLT